MNFFEMLTLKNFFHLFKLCINDKKVFLPPFVFNLSTSMISRIATLAECDLEFFAVLEASNWCNRDLMLFITIKNYMHSCQEGFEFLKTGYSRHLFLFKRMPFHIICVLHTLSWRNLSGSLNLLLRHSLLERMQCKSRSWQYFSKGCW